ncbi:putative colanic acid biosynthesis acetyltransferase [Zobellia galactanivorans]|uniref:putative colanic acid biosynthesis acetyltransferase n=1 Tax=Zobellia galactanivorans (strain DSM 12802 / CCUG 47099 / CIP 106680 / NCIMB 13871 / Dsij) TaxID=63186 RepID=UPI0026E2E739|nr:putative colanic acid biosynthesis acetyltransferase [Zobellia galactanivorans]MDO6810414.1 putative colanic acid biosynthesis acetyltransferase [Zobellia galactanivorans]
MEEITLNKYSEVKPKFLKRIIWLIVNKTIFRCLVGDKLFAVRNAILRMFGAQLPKRVLIYSSCDIYAPWNLKVGKFSCLGPHTEIYNKDRIVIGENAVISQGTYLCSASHDITSLLLPLVTKPITIGNRAWVAADAFIGPGVTIGEGAVVGARAAVFRDVEPWTVVGGNPAKFIKAREIKD